jgi:trk system potassium uptake protein TrkH
MLLGGMNFVYLHLLLTRPRNARQGLDVTATYLGLIFACVALVVLLIKGSIYSTWGEALRFGSFQVISLATTTGFGTADSSIWPIAAQMAIVMITLIGACNGSTGGGIKHDRILVFFKLLRFRFRQMIHPTLIPAIRVDGRLISTENVERAVFYIVPYLGVLGVSTLLLACLGMASVDAFTGSAACLANAGPGMGSVGSMGNYSMIPELGKVILSLVMLLGRLEIFALALPFTPGFWKV